MNFLKMWADKFIDNFIEDDNNLYHRIEQKKAEFHKNLAKEKTYQKESLLSAAFNAETKEEEELFKILAEVAEKQAKDSELESRIRAEHMQAIIDVQLGRHHEWN